MKEKEEEGVEKEEEKDLTGDERYSCLIIYLEMGL